MPDTSPSQTPRKSPVQGRSQATVDAILTATLQVLAVEGLDKFTTTRVAARAGVSVGSLYQYFPNKQALLAATLERHVRRVAESVCSACSALHGRPAREMVAGLVRAFLTAKLKNPEESKSLYAVSENYGGRTLVAEANGQIMEAVTAMLATAPDLRLASPDTATAMVISSMTGPVRAYLEGTISSGFGGALQGELERLLIGYLQSSTAKDSVA